MVKVNGTWTWVPNPEFRSNGGYDLNNLCTAISRIIYENPELVQLVQGVEQNKKYSRFTKVVSEDTLNTLLKETFTGKDTSATGRNTQTVLSSFMSRLRRDRGSQWARAGKNEADGFGPFQSLTKAEAVETKKAIIESFAKPRTSENLVMNKEEAGKKILDVLQSRGLGHLFHLSVAQMAHPLMDYVTTMNTHRDSKLQQEIDTFMEKMEVCWGGKDMDMSELRDIHFHNQLLNEVVAEIDGIIKIKASIELAIPKLMDGSLIYLKLWDKECGKVMPMIGGPV